MAGYQELTIGRLVDILIFHSIQDAMWRLLRYKCNRCDIWNLAIVLFFSRGGSRKAHRDPLTTGASSDRNAVLAGIGKKPTHGAMNVYFSHPIRQKGTKFRRSVLRVKSQKLLENPRVGQNLFKLFALQKLYESLGQRRPQYKGYRIDCLKELKITMNGIKGLRYQRWFPSFRHKERLRAKGDLFQRLIALGA